MLQVGTSITMSGTTGILTATQFIGDGSLLTGISAGSFASNDTGINTTTSVGVGTTNATGAADVKNSAILNVGVVTAVTVFSNIVATAATFTGTVKGDADYTIQNLTGVAATFTGVLTYEDVINIDSIGIITARSGVNFGAAGVGGTITGTGQAEFVGVVTASDFVGGGSQLTGLPAGFTELDAALFN